MTERRYLFPTPAGPLRSLLDFAAAHGKKFSEDEATIDVMLALDRGDLKGPRYYCERWSWSRSTTHRRLASLVTEAQNWRAFHGKPWDSVGQSGTAWTKSRQCAP